MYQGLALNLNFPIKLQSLKIDRQLFFQLKGNKNNIKRRNFRIRLKIWRPFIAIKTKLKLRYKSKHITFFKSYYKRAKLKITKHLRFLVRSRIKVQYFRKFLG